MAVIFLSFPILSGCSSPTEGDIYACKDWATAYDHYLRASAETNGHLPKNPTKAEAQQSAMQLGAIDYSASEDFKSAADFAVSPSLHEALIAEATHFELGSKIWQGDVEAISEMSNYPSKPEVIFRECKRLGVNVELNEGNKAPWYEQ